MKASKKIFSLVLGTSMFFTGMPECFAMMESAGQDSTPPSATDVPSEEAADGSSGLGSPAPESPDSPDMTDVDISPLFWDIVLSGGTTSSRPGTPVPLPPEGADAVQPQIVEDVATDAGTASSEHGSSTSSLAVSAAHDAEPEERHDVPLSDEILRRSASSDTLSDEGETSGEMVAPQPQVSQEGEDLADSLDVGPAAGAGTALSRSPSRSSDGGETFDDESESERSSAASSRSVSPDTSSDEGETFDGEREEETVTFPAPPLPPVAPGRIAEAVHISAPGTEKFSFFAKTVDVAVVVPPSLSRNVVTNIISRVWNPTAGKCTVNGTKRKVKFDLIGSDNLNSLKNYRVIIYSLGPNIEQWRSAEDRFLRDIQPINSMAEVIFITVDGDALTFDFLPFMVRLFDKADPNFSPWTWTPSQITGAKRGGIAAACVGGALFAIKKVNDKFKNPNQKKLKKQHKNDKKSEQNQIATSSKHFKKMNAIY